MTDRNPTDGDPLAFNDFHRVARPSSRNPSIPRIEDATLSRVATMVFECKVCRRSLSAQPSQAGMLTHCPTCQATLRIPGTPAPAVSAEAQSTASAQPTASAATGSVAAASSLAPPAAAAGTAVASPPAAAARRSPPPARPPGVSSAARRGGNRYGFNCVYCSSRLEATEAMAAQEGSCPTCGNTITIPILDRFGRLIDPVTKQIIKQDPHPVHAYAAAGQRAPKILRTSPTTQLIVCPRCSARSPITANNCASCGMPFTMEGTTIEAGGSSNGFCVASLVLGIISLPTGIMVVPPILAIVFGILGLRQLSGTGESGRGRGLAITGIVLGSIGLFEAVYLYFLK